MTIHPVTGGEGYDYLTGQVASGDELRQRGQDPEDYYARSGEQPGYWLGQGSPALGLAGVVDSAVMTALWSQPAARHTNRTTVAGFDFTFSPVKSVSVLWAVAPVGVQQIIEAAHRSAVAQTVAYMERFAATRPGWKGNPVPAPGFVVAAFEHRTSRTGDPDLHTHAAVMNRAQSPDGQWRALHHRPLFQATVSASEFYNARLEDALVRDLGVAFEDRPRRDPALRPVREVIGVPPELLLAFSGRRQQIEARAAELAAARGLDHRRSVKADAALHQWATLDTRQAKGPQKSLTQRVAGWQATAERVLGPGGLFRMFEAVRQAVHVLDPRTLAQVARDIRARALRDRPQPRPLHYRAEAERQLRAHPDAIADRDRVVTTVTETVISMGEPTVTEAQQQMLDLAALGARIRAAKPTSPERLAIAAAAEFYRQQAAGSWVPEYLQSRGLVSADAGYAPGRTALVTHLRGLGFTEQVMLDAGLAGRSERGHLHDVFRDRMVLPIRDVDGPVGFTARKPPTDLNDAHPKYLNSRESPVFHKRELLYGLTADAADRLRAGAGVLLVEGPTDALAADVSRETSVPLAVCGTALTVDHLRALDKIAPLRDRAVVVAMDPDGAGQAAAVKAYMVLTEFGATNVRAVRLTADPADMHQQGTLTAALRDTVPLQDVVVDQVIARWPNPEGWAERRVNAMRELGPVIAAMTPEQRVRQTGRAADLLALSVVAVNAEVAQHVTPEPVTLATLGLPAAPARTWTPAAPVRERAVSY